MDTIIPHTIMDCVIGIVAKQLKISRDDILGASLLRDDLHADENDVFAILTGIENWFEFEVVTHEAVELEAVRELADYVGQHIKVYAYASADPKRFEAERQDIVQGAVSFMRNKKLFINGDDTFLKLVKSE